MSDYKLTIFNNTFQTKGEVTQLSKELNDIANGTYKTQILNCREALIDKKDKVLYKKLKTQLKAVTFCGSFEGGRKLSNLTFYNKILVIDIDGIDKKDLNDLKAKLISDQYIMAVWTSPSLSGLKGLVKINSTPESHKIFFSSLSIYFLQKYGIELDKSGNDITRLCYVSWDENIYINFNSKVYDELLNINLFDTKTSKNEQPAEDFKSSLSLIKSAYATEGMNKPKAKKQIKKIIRFLTNKGISITQNYDDWVKVAIIIANTFSFDIGEKFFLNLCILDKELHNEHKSKELIKYCYNNRKLDGVKSLTFATLIFLASQKGFKVK